MAKSLVTKKPKKAAKKKAVKNKVAKVTWNPNKKLTDKEELFVRYYVLNEATRLNATRSYDLAYGKNLEGQDKEDAVKGTRINQKSGMEEEYNVKESSYDRCYVVCKKEGSVNLTKPHIERRKYELLNELMTDTFVDGELAKVIQQDGDRPSKVRAINEYNKLGGRIISKEVHAHAFMNDDMSDAELLKRVEEQKKFFTKQ